MVLVIFDFIFTEAKQEESTGKGVEYKVDSAPLESQNSSKSKLSTVVGFFEGLKEAEQDLEY